MRNPRLTLLPTLIVLMPLFPTLWPFLSFGGSGTGARPNRAVWQADACGLLTWSEIEAVQGEPVTAVKESLPDRPAFSVAQCFYTLAQFSKSVSVELVTRNAGDPNQETPRERWRKRFHEGATSEDEEGARPPRPVPGLGDEAFWTGNAVTGGLYVLKGDAYLRIGVGGPGDESVKLERAARLARNALARL